jgi:hypothetical protein
MAHKPLNAKVRQQQATKGRRKPPLGPTLAEMHASLPSPVGVAAVEGILDAIEQGAHECGLRGVAAPALRSIFGMLLGVAIDAKEGATLSVEGAEPVHIRKADAQYVAFKSLAELTRLEVAHAIGKAKKGRTEG